MLLIKTTSRFLKDLRLAKKRGYDIDKLEAIVDHLQTEKPLPPKNRDHTLTGEWNHHRECHIQPDWLLIYKIEATSSFSNVQERTPTFLTDVDFVNIRRSRNPCGCPPHPGHIVWQKCIEPLGLIESSNLLSCPVHCSRSDSSLILAVYNLAFTAEYTDVVKETC